jgi:hypothetical protein
VRAYFDRDSEIFDRQIEITLLIFFYAGFEMADCSRGSLRNNIRAERENGKKPQDEYCDRDARAVTHFGNSLSSVTFGAVVFTENAALRRAVTKSARTAVPAGFLPHPLKREFQPNCIIAAKFLLETLVILIKELFANASKLRPCQPPQMKLLSS